MTFQYFVKMINVREYLLFGVVTFLLLALSLGKTIAIVGVLTALAIAFVRIKKIKIFHFFGIISYSLYLIHVPIGGRIVNLGKRFATTDVEYFMVSLFGFCLSVFVAYLFYKIIEKPANEWSSRIKYRRSRIKEKITNIGINDKNIQTKNA